MQRAATRAKSYRGVLDGLFELTSVVPLAGFVLVHLASYGRTLFGATELGARRAVPGWAVALELLLVWLPLGFHAVYSISVWRRRRRAEAPDAPDRAWLALERVSGVVLAAFLADHLLRFRLPILRGDRYPGDAFNLLAAELSRTAWGFPLVAGLHLLGALALGFHLGFGLMRIADRRAPEPSRFRWRALALAVGCAAGVAGTLTILHLATG